MKKVFLLVLAFAMALALCGCAVDEEPAVRNTFEETPPELSSEYTENYREITLKTYYELSDGTWKADGNVYKHKLVLTGRLNNAVRDITYTILSNMEDITFDQAWKASGLSSNSEDYFDVKDAVFVAIK